ncbi:MAG: hypothetical protein H6623_09170 [Bdellovibrionaceae bacterium]|nr:hypothetical protein [Pseudobdellovibrionaceae bacterium]
MIKYSLLRTCLRAIVFIFAIGFSFFVYAADNPSFDNISDADFKTIAKEFSSLFVHTSATPPTSLGKVFGVEAAVIGGVSAIPGIEAISKRQDPTIKMPYAPFAVLFAAVSVPYGITIETNLLPKIDVSSLNLQHTGIAAKWSITDLYWQNLPFDLAVKTYFSKSEIGFSQIVNNGSGNINVDVGFKNTMQGAEALFGWDFLVVQPYVGGGFVTSRSELNGTATVDPSFSLFVDNVSQSKKTSVSSARWIVGCQFNLTVLKASLEYNNVFGNNRLAAKLGFAF